MGENIHKLITSGIHNGDTVEQLRLSLTKSGFPPEKVERELVDAAPYIASAQRLKARLDVRNALFKTLDRQLRHLPQYLKPQKRRLPPFVDFLHEYYYPARLGLFESVLDNCEAKHWTPRIMAEKAGPDALIEIQYGRDAGTRYEHSASRYTRKVRLGEYVDIIENTESSNNVYVSGSNYLFNRTAFAGIKQEVLALGGGDYLVSDRIGRTMDIFFGPRGTVTTMHHDQTNNLFIQVYGRKLFRLFPSLQVPYMYDDSYTHGSDFEPIDVDLKRYPEFANATVVEIEVGPGDALFIPVGWWHHVTALSASISLACANLNVDEIYYTATHAL